MIPKPLVSTEPSTVRAFSFDVATSMLDGILLSEAISNIWVALGYVINNHFFVQNAHKDWLNKYSNTWQDPFSWMILGFHDEAGAVIANCTSPGDTTKCLSPLATMLLPWPLATVAPTTSSTLGLGPLSALIA